MQCWAMCQAAFPAQDGHRGQAQPKMTTLPVGGCCWPHPKGHSSFQERCTIRRQAQRCAPQALRMPRPGLPSPCLMLTNLSSLCLSSIPSWPPCFPGDFGHPPEHLRPLAFVLWPSTSSFSSAAASPQFSATGSTPSHKKADLPGRPSLCPDLVWHPHGLRKSLCPGRPARDVDEDVPSLYFG